MPQSHSPVLPADRVKRGYLNTSFRLFHLTDIPKEEFQAHYHEFDKIIIFLSGHVTYLIEGRSYELRDYDIVLVRHNEIHRPIIDTSVTYDRIIIYLSPDYLTAYKTADYDLNTCFDQAAKNCSEVLRVRNLKNSRLFQIIKNLESAGRSQSFANPLYCEVLFLEFMICLNRSMLESHMEYLSRTSADPRVQKMLDYINSHLAEELDVDTLAASQSMSRFHMMRLFKQETGYTIIHYITSKRLMLARELLTGSLPITDISYQCGFGSYASFSRIYKETFGESPRETRRRL